MGHHSEAGAAKLAMTPAVERHLAFGRGSFWTDYPILTLVVLGGRKVFLDTFLDALRKLEGSAQHRLSISDSDTPHESIDCIYLRYSVQFLAS